MKKYFILLFIILFLCGFGYSPHKKNNDKTLKCYAGVVIDQDSGRVLYSKNGDKLLPMASTTKIMTAIVAIEKGNLNDIVTISKRAAMVSGSTAGFKAGEKVTLEELLYGLMLRSGNDAAIAISEHIGGSVDKFVELMNDKAIELGAYSTSFITPHGLDAVNHYTTAEDLAKITAYALKNDTFAKISNTKSIAVGVYGKFKRSYSNINKFLYKLENADGVKTGFTGKAGKCLVASVKHKNGRYISVVLNSNDRWSDAEKMIKYADQNYKYVQICKKGNINNKLRVYGGNIEYVYGKVNKDLYIPILKNDSEIIDVQTFVPTTLFSPLNENEIIGNLVVFIKDKIVAKYPIFCNEVVKRKNIFSLSKYEVD